jgi:hypothetical protein
MRIMIITTTNTSTMISAYSTSPWPLSPVLNTAHTSFLDSNNEQHNSTIIKDY